MEEEELKKVVVPKKPADIQRYKVERLMKNPEKPVFIPEKKEEREPRVFRPPEFIRNIWGSSAGVGSGDFHIYRNMRRRQYAREKYMDYKTEKERLDAEYRDKVEDNAILAEEKTAKKRAKRLKKKRNQKAKKKKGNNIKETKANDSSSEESEEEKQSDQDSGDDTNKPENTETSKQSKQTDVVPQQIEDANNGNSISEADTSDKTQEKT